ncbi:MAG: response regulator [Microcystis sp. M015S2]|uniref:ATP-binding response regulator n=1 Tax=unclassified Microcystis TaxID=2643300 RepID=UPI0025854D08|nr:MULTISPECIES: ATP-binding protein [unclassified Microcystis]MCA2708518.1 response regulator [Microcystis sp. M025S2]MCA2743892.1 response regulator [Microcystis sp. M015S2]MCA2758581.1 response regulator [Microcystis sp. M145S2]
MPSVTLSLDHFNQSVTTCELIVDRASLCDLINTGNPEAIVVVDERYCPLGLIESQALIAYLLYQQQHPETRNPSCNRLDLSGWLRPIIPLNSRMAVSEFLTTLTGEAIALAPILVDAQGKLLGRLDTGKLLQFCLGRSILDDPPPQPRISDRISPRSDRPLKFLEQLPLPLLLYSPEAGILYQNQAWCQQIGAAFPANIDNSPFALVNDPLTLPSPTPPLFPQRLETVTSGLTKTWRLLSVPLNLTDNYPLIEKASGLWLLLATDITEQQQYCQELAVKNADLVHLNRLKDEFLACVSHEFKSPLTAVIGLSSLLREQKIGELNPRQSKYADLIYRSGRQLMALVNDLLDLTRLETGQLQLTLSRVKIDRLCQRVYDIIVDKYPQRLDLPSSYRLDIESGLDYVLADEARLQQMLVHLLDNAVKFTIDGGNLGIKVNRWENWLAFTVWDTGIGIPEESQHLIFQKFQQLESPFTRQFEGAGLSLVLSQKLARCHGGDLSFVSKAQEGSEFTLLLPVHPQGAEQESATPQRLVLVVEANPQVIEQFVDRLSELGLKTIIARSGTEAIEKARQLKPRCVFLNPNLPLLSGWDVLTLLKSHPQTKDIKVIVTAADSDRNRSQQQGADSFLVPPITSAALQACLNLTVSPVPSRKRRTAPTLLRLHGHYAPNFSDLSSFSWIWNNQLVRENYRFIEADSCEQAELLATVWEVDAILIDSSIAEDLYSYLQTLSESETLANLPLVTLDVAVTEVANQIPGLVVFPCLAPPTENRIEQLLKVIETADLAFSRHKER